MPFYAHYTTVTTTLVRDAHLVKSPLPPGLVIDYPNSAKRKKYFLCLFVGGAEGQHKQTLPSALTEEEDAAGGVYRRQQVKFGDADSRAAAAERRAQSKSKTKQRTSVKDRDWVVRKKETQRRKGDTVPADSKFTARKRKVSDESLRHTLTRDNAYASIRFLHSASILVIGLPAKERRSSCS